MVTLFSFQFSKGSWRSSIDKKYFEWNLGAEVVLSLTGHQEVNCSLTTFFTDIQLTDVLSCKKTYAMGRVRFNRIANCPFAPRAKKSKMEIGSMEFALEKSNGILAVCWKEKQSYFSIVQCS